jgi:two-component system sensor histidine kinase MprB
VSLRFRLVLLTSALVIVGVVGSGTSNFLSTRSGLSSSIDDFLRERAGELVDGARRLPPDRGRRGDDDQVGNPPTSAADPDTVVQQLDRDGIIVTSNGLVELPVNVRDREIAERKVGPSLRTVTVDGTRIRMITQHIDGGGAVQVGRSIDENDDTLGGLRSRAVLTAIGLSLVAATVGWWLVGRAMRPLRALSQSVEKISETQDLTVPIPMGGNDEVGRLAKSFNEMLAALRQSRLQQHQLIQDAAHELRTPLTTIRANIELLSRYPEMDPGDRDAMLTSLRSEVEELSTLFNEVVELATDVRNDAPFASVDLNDPSEHAARIFAARSTRTLHMEFNGSNVMGNTELLTRAIGNLLTNGEKYSTPGGDLWLVISGTRVDVHDEGPGISPSDQDRIFDRFYRADQSRASAGSGLGLAIVKQIVQQHGGDVHVGDSPRGGAVVGFQL